MAKIRHISVLLAMLFFVAACNTAYLDQADTPVLDDPYAAWHTLHLVELGEHVTMAIPQELRDVLKMRWNESFGRLEISAGKSLDMLISESLEDVEYKRFDLERGIFEVIYLEEDAEYVFYKTSLPDASTVYYHFYLVKQIDGRMLQVENNPLVEFTEEEVGQMLKVARTINSDNKDTI